MAQGYTLQQAQQMGFQSTTATPVNTQPQGYTLQQAQQMGYTPSSTPATQPVDNSGNLQGTSDAMAQGFGAAANIVPNIASDLQKRYQNINSAVQAPANNPVSKLFQTIGQIFGGAGDVIKESTAPVISPIVNAISDDKTVQQSAMNGQDASILNLMDSVGKAYDTFKQAHPEAAGNIEAGGNIAQFLPLEKIFGLGTDALNTGAKAISDTASNIKDSVIPPSPPPGTPEGDAAIQSSLDKARQNVADAYKKSMPLTSTQNVKEQNLLNKTGDNVYTTLAKYNISPASEDAIPKLQSISDQFQTAIQIAQDNEHAMFNVDEIKQNALDNINQNINSASARKLAISKINTELSDLMEETPSSFIKGANGETLAGSDIVERLRKTGNDWTNFNSADPEKVGQSTGYALSDAVRDQVEKQGTFPEYREANRQWGKVIHAQEVLQKIEDSGKQFKQLGGLSGTIARRIISGVVGLHTGGIGGAILSELGSEYGAKILSNPDLRTYFDRQLIEKFGNADATLASIEKLTQQVKDYVDTQNNLSKLPAPSYIEQGAPADKSGIEITNAKKTLPTANPKTGRMQTTYSSESQDLKNVDNAPIKKPIASDSSSPIPKSLPPKTKKVK